MPELTSRSPGRYLRHPFLIGLVAGTAGGLVGLGGGVVMIPLLIAWLGFSRHQAHATSLAAVAATGAAGAVTYALKGQVDLWAAAILAVSALLSARGGAKLAQRLPAADLRRWFGLLLLLVAALLLLARPWLGIAPPSHGLLAWTGLIASGLAAGFIAGLLGVGGGSIMVPGMVLLAGLGQHLAQGTSLVAMIPAALLATVVHARAGTVVVGSLPTLVPGAMIGGILGAQVALALPDGPLRLCFAGFLGWMGWRDWRAGRVVTAAAAAAPPVPDR